MPYDVTQAAIDITGWLSIPLAELRYHFSRSGGKGGQNVNKVETRVELLFDVVHSPSLSDEQRRAIIDVLGSKIDSGGILRIVAQKSRSQWKNRELAAAKFVALMRHALQPKKMRVETKTTRAAREKRLDQKKRRSTTKRLRRGEEW